MPRLPPLLLRLANRESYLLPALLRECRDLPSSRNELRWLTEHATEQAEKLRTTDLASSPSRTPDSRNVSTPSIPSKNIPGWRNLLRDYVKRREKGEPLQYILGTQPFGELEILCRPGVLIPRWETEVYTSKIGLLARTLLVEQVWENRDQELGSYERPLRVLDLCTGTGCIPLGIYGILKNLKIKSDGKSESRGGGKLKLEFLGVDISTTALNLAKENLRHNISLGYLPEQAADEIVFLHADVLLPSPPAPRPAAPYLIDVIEEVLGKGIGKPEIDILTANPPYISPIHFSSGRTTRSVRQYEPRLALVPSSCSPQSSTSTRLGWSTLTSSPSPGDEFYHHILPLAKHLNARLTVLEVADTEQAERVAEITRRVFLKEGKMVGESTHPEVLIEIWFDDGGSKVCLPPDGVGLGLFESNEVSARAVVVWTRCWATSRRQQLEYSRR
ncbi:hypothetical protein EPUS_01058 [Endocarpon pusillum Z07020]|uniref:Uncharacterized protein n=1 Tax=Endocarpon pusillum (strain Z07020 / HMAS-L-300199) TaxID=1263415 RepID=U1FW76_ENDPU|nr:uncharacterized protein EPUS_01058 [Endocarpon pusillum Z07020]ERF69102.1 hypothetical protein EPUS_01058 [Endocarpon pusillum Z07020]